MYNKKPTLTYDLAYNCATVDASIVEPCTKEVRTIVNQVTELEQVLKKGSQYGTFYQQNALFTFWIGINDAHITANNGNILDKDIDGKMEKVANRYMEILSTLYTYGAKNFMLLNVPREYLYTIGHSTMTDSPSIRPDTTSLSLASINTTSTPCH